MLVLSVIVAACGGSRPAPPASAPTAAARTEPPVTPPAHVPRPVPPVPPALPALPGVRVGPRELWRGVESVLGRDDTMFERVPAGARYGDLLYGRKSDYWSPCVRDFVQTQPDAAREVLGEALSLYSTSCTSSPARRVEFQTPRTSRTAPQQSYLGLSGALQAATCELALTAAYHGDAVEAERITLIADGVRWSSPRIDFDRDGGWEIATLPLTRALARVVKRALEARDTLLRFEAAQGYEDVVLTEEMKQDLRVMIDALDAINRP